MKKILFIVLVAITSVGFSQETIKEGVVLSKQTMSTDNAELQSQLAMVGDIVTTTYFKGNKSRSETNNFMTGTSVTIMDNDNNQMLMTLNNQMVGKKYVLKSMEPSEEDLENITVTKGDETKNILGYECQEYNVEVNKDGVVVKMDIYTTDKLSALSQQSTMMGADIKGFPMYLTMNMNQMGMNLTITQEATEIKKEAVSDDKFDMTPPEGYEKTDNLQGM
ncbi:MAG: hypothetical protein CMP05_04940 [Xanthomarina sp.]|uniref:DUF4412 domain-containing protein n=2 Tax=Xanthomarina gelatinilytica TaxID=1137281 RepID=M7NDK1_9FLAO|nr:MULTISPECIES: hypothetical protein [Xanthomarina]EMQ96593.1 hypothetical protein D778_01075 [Xanthomarina gelatinilytica]MAL22124.1 hypothetical protein [Xanthomarina sp.]MBF61328.1 hypothetical protein [Xanthomarina sp.]HAB27179.1 hypothetical protein [Xanthomarina gelatinilytica]HCY82161.1 hypothetical protein [Xanthomarina gelatinilytica]